MSRAAIFSVTVTMLALVAARGEALPRAAMRLAEIIPPIGASEKPNAGAAEQTSVTAPSA